MISFKQRSYQKELLDNENIPFEDIRRNMQELNSINTWLGGHNITIAGVRRLLKHDSFHAPVHIVEIGSGGGDNLAAIRKWLFRNNVPCHLTGIDLNPASVEFSRQQHAGINFILSDYKMVTFTERPHIIFASLFFHHFTDKEIHFLLQWMHRNSLYGFFINDLHRHPLAYYSIKWLTKAFSKSYLVKNDAPLSVLRSFRKQDWHTLFRDAGIPLTSLQWMWAFRWLVTSQHHAGSSSNI